MSEIDAAELISSVSRLKSCNWPDAHIVLDALEKARGDLEELVQATTEQTEACIRLVEASQAMKEAAITFKAERDAAKSVGSVTHIPSSPLIVDDAPDPDEAMRAALEPFAEAAKGIPDSSHDTAPACRISHDAMCPGTFTTINNAAFRRALAALKGNGEGR